jgi:tRNA G18 (ribose-2'-O)-methylase SpoU
MTLLLGSERTGLPAELVDTCDETVSIPLAGAAESLNVAVAGALALYELSRPK